MQTKNGKSISQVLMDLASNDTAIKNFTYHDLLEKLGFRAFGIALILFALPSALPFSIIPGISTLFSLPLAVFALQMIIGNESLWLPKILANKEIQVEKLNKVIIKTLPYIQKLEKLLKPRISWLSSSWMNRINGLFIFCLALLLMLPIPLSNFIFSGLIILFGLGISEKDGLMIALAYLGSFIYVSSIAVIIFAFVIKLI